MLQRFHVSQPLLDDNLLHFSRAQQSSFNYLNICWNRLMYFLHEDVCVLAVCAAVTSTTVLYQTHQALTLFVFKLSLIDLKNIYICITIMMFGQYL